MAMEQAIQIGAVDPISHVLRRIGDRAADGTIARASFDDIVDEIHLPARLYQAAAKAAVEAGIVILDDEEEPPEDESGWDGDGFGLFVARSQHRILTPEEEFALGERVDRGQLAQQALDSRPDMPPEIQRDFQRRVEDGHHALDDFAKHNMRLVISVVGQKKGACGPALEFEDLVQEGYFGLVRAIQKFDRHRGLKFSTYATYWIRQSVQRAIDNKATVVRLPVHSRETLRRLVRAEAELQTEDHQPTVEELAAHVEVSVKVARELMLWRRRAASLDQRISGGSATIGDFVSDPNDSTTEAAAQQVALEDAIDRVLVDFTPKESDIIRRRFGLNGHEPQTLEAIGNDYGVTRERIRQIEAKAMKKLKFAARKGELYAFMHDDED